MPSHSPRRSRGKGLPLDDSGPHLAALSELQEAAVVYDALVKVRDDLLKSGIVADKRRNTEWNAHLSHSVKDIIRRTQEACSVTTNSSAQRAVLMLTRKDLLTKGLEGVMVLLSDIQLPDIAAIVKALLEQYTHLCKQWQVLLEDQEREAEGKLSKKSEECSLSQQALAELLEASQRLQHDSEILVEENRALHVELDIFVAASMDSRRDSVDLAPEVQVVHVAEPAWAEKARAKSESYPGSPAKAELKMSSNSRARPSRSMSPLKGPLPKGQKPLRLGGVSPAKPVASRQSTEAPTGDRKSPRGAGTMLSSAGRLTRSPLSGRPGEQAVTGRTAALKVASKPTMSSQSKQRQKSPLALPDSRKSSAVQRGSEKASPAKPKADRRSPLKHRWSAEDVSDVHARGKDKSSDAHRSGKGSLEGPPPAGPKVAARRRHTVDIGVTTHAKELSLKQLQALISELCASKVRSNAHYKSLGAMQETMQQHLQSLLGQKFGLKELVREWEIAVMTACERFEHCDAHVEVFRKVLTNEVEEECIVRLKELEKLMSTSLAEVLVSKLGLQEASPDLAKAVDSRKQGVIMQDEWSLLIPKVFRPGEAVDLMRWVLHMASPEHTGAGAQRDAAGVCIEYSVLLNAVLHRYLKNHERTLRPVIDAFRKVDAQQTGILTPAQFAQFCSTINSSITPREVSILLAAMDPNGHGRVTFSSCASVLSTELERLAEAEYGNQRA